jgi:tRNA wybutosine-synthesizing protein 1
MDTVREASHCWDAVRIPLTLLAVIIWFCLTWRRSVTSQQQSHENSEKLSGIVPEEPQALETPVAEDANTPETSSQNADLFKKAKKSPKKFTRATPTQPAIDISGDSVPPEIHIFYASQFNHTSNLARHLLTLLSEYTRLHDISVIPNLDDYFLQHPANAFYFLLLPSYANDSGPTQPLIYALEDTLNDFRVDANPLGTVRFAVFGTGDKEGWPLKSEYCYQAVKVEKLMEQLGAKRTFTLGMGDTKGRTSLETQLENWTKKVLEKLNGPIPEPEIESVEEDDGSKESTLLDVEDIAIPLSKSPASPAPPEMVSNTSLTYRALTKQGYTIVGTHSGVKICRWTKSALRGRGSCYKFSFYGIKSHLCMETTPSLACANKCVFCWRHGTNPVGTSWRWQVDPPEVVYNGALEGHYKKIKMLRGMQGVRAERYEEATRVRHCALSLVGEPIFCMSMGFN